MGLNTFNPMSQETEASEPLCLRPAGATKWVLGHPQLQSENVLKKKKKQQQHNNTQPWCISSEVWKKKKKEGHAHGKHSARLAERLWLWQVSNWQAKNQNIFPLCDLATLWLLGQSFWKGQKPPSFTYP